MTFPLVPLRVPMMIIAPDKEVLWVTYIDKILTSDGIVRRHTSRNIRAWMRRHNVILNKKSYV